MRWLVKIRGGFQSQGGISLLETLIALGILAAIGIAFLTGLSTTSKTTDLYFQKVTAANLAQSQVEILKSAAFDDTAPYYDNLSPSLSVPQGYSVSINTVVVEADKQDITVTVSKDNRPLFKLKIRKTNWA